MKISRLHTLRGAAYDAAQPPCLRCQFRLFTTIPDRRQQAVNSKPIASGSKLVPPTRKIAPEKIRKGFVLQPIGAPIGFPSPPKSSDDWAIIERSGGTAKERNTANRELLWKKWHKPYMRDIRNMDVNRGKFYLANERLYRKEVALYFPNLLGTTLASRESSDTTGILHGRVSIVTMFSKAWAEEQIRSWIGNPKDTQASEVLQTIASSGGEAQLVEVNHENSKLVAMFYPILRYSIARARAPEQHKKYFMLGGGGLPQTVKDTLALMNDRIGYIFLVDRDYKIRWSGCGDATEAEKESLLRGLKKLIAEKKA